jgi:hypothetical protein
MQECDALSEYESGKLQDILRTHGVNMRKANVCIQRHTALLKTVDEVIRCYGE